VYTEHCVIPVFCSHICFAGYTTRYTYF